VSWQDEIDELARRKQLAEQMGGPEALRDNVRAAS
jgi:hypothetical protein